MNRLDSRYLNLLDLIVQLGADKSDRTGTGTKSIFGAQIRHCMCDGFPLLTTKKMPLKTIATELKWFLKGDTNIKYLHDNNCHIWDGDYEKSGREDGELGPIYGKQWRSWGSHRQTNHILNETKTIHPGIDQMKNLIDGLKNNPDSRRHMVSAWNVSELDQMTLPPCHYGFQCNVSDGVLSLMWNQRSVDTFLGLPFNIASYGLLLLLLCEETGYTPGNLIGNLGDVHLYNNHLDQAKEQMNRVGYEDLPTLTLSNVDILNGEFDFELKDYQSHPTIKAPLSN
ncbi:MAG: thymidylate synthase [Schleiferiaceae bacterium]|nr:thymidylate synthase [Schleiferiaceae bacterium]